MDYPDIGLARIKESERTQIQEQIEAFIARGGKIDRIESNTYSSKLSTLVDDIGVFPAGGNDDLFA